MTDTPDGQQDTERRQEVYGCILRSYCVNLDRGELDDGDRFLINREVDNVLALIDAAVVRELEKFEPDEGSDGAYYYTGINGNPNDRIAELKGQTNG